MSSARQIAGYRVLAKVGEGAASDLYAVQDPKTKQVWALKQVHVKTPKDQRFVEQVESEYEVGSKLDHANIRGVEKLVRQTRLGEPGTPDFVNEHLAWGAGPRAVQFLLIGAKARALIHTRPHVTVDDIRALAKPVLRHRIIVNYAALSEGITADDVIDQILDTVATPDAA